ncbi:MULTISPECIES: hypothetical protein [Vibrio]|uniref:hypothetical protein n=1 Tax=Vibrio TaxID=662 RepID=UPI00078D2A34|nr:MULTISPECIES: hypothetical protein [Vibrio]BAU71062.1 hypothetical protein [Vibrio sp. 04Ya108]BBM67678.1 hypothetical protein VA249_43240 [Vibrio alfacsensis]BCN27175.1 hypothetical protein VYA_43670 [Vibrio alfacsensis]
MMTDLDLLLAELDSISQTSLVRGYFHPAYPDFVVERATSAKNPQLFMRCISSIEQVVKLPTLGMVKLIEAQIQSPSVMSVSLSNYHAQLTDCAILDRCPVFHLINALKELPFQMEAPEELVVLTKHLAKDRNKGIYFEYFFMGNYQLNKTISVGELNQWTLMNLTNLSVNDIALGESKCLQVGHWGTGHNRSQRTSVD